MLFQIALALGCRNYNDKISNLSTANVNANVLALLKIRTSKNRAKHRKAKEINLCTEALTGSS